MTDKILADHLQNNPMNERYLLPYIKKKLIIICGQQLQQRIVPEYNRYSEGYFICFSYSLKIQGGFKAC